MQRLSLLAPERAEILLAYAISLGITWVDTADLWGCLPGDAEQRLGTLRSRLPSLTVATKGGLISDGPGVRADGREAHLIAACEASCRRLGVDRIALYQLHAVDPRTPYADQLRTLGKLVTRGLVLSVGLCNVRVGELVRALDELPIVSVQVELSPFRPHAARSGVIEAARDRGLAVLGYRPLGGVQGLKRLRRDPVLHALAQERGVSLPRLVLAWIRELGVQPLCGPTSATSIDELAASRTLTLDPEIRARLDAHLEPGRLLRSPPSRNRPVFDERRRVVLVMGRPGAGKTTRALGKGETAEEAPLRLNRDARGGTLDDLIAPLEEALARGVQRIVLDNTYAARAGRRQVIEAARAHGVPTDCIWMTTSDDDAEVNIINRILDTIGYLPEPAEFERLNRAHPGVIPPRAASRYRQDFEPPSLDEGFARIEEIAFVRREETLRTKRALVLDPVDLVSVNRSSIAALVDDGFLPIVIGWEPADGESARAEVLQRLYRRAASIGFAVRAWSCPHPAGHALCWCRKPLPGLLVQAMRELCCDPRRSVMFSHHPGDRSIARKLGIPVHER